MNNELERMWQEAVMTSFEVLSSNLSGRTEKNNKTSCQDSWTPSQDLNL
jgi:hypothetical protein